MHYPAAYDITEEFPEATRALILYDPIPFQGVVPRIRYGEHEFAERSFLFTDSSFFSFFDFPAEYGDPKSAMKEVNSLVLTHEISEKLFGPINPVGKPVTFNDSVSFKVTAVLAPIRFNTYLRFDYLAHADYLIQAYMPRL